MHTEVGYFPPFSVQGAQDFQRNGKSFDDEGHGTFLLADEAERWIRARSELSFLPLHALSRAA